MIYNRSRLINGRLLLRVEGRYRLREATLTVANGVIEGIDLPEAPYEKIIDLQRAIVIPAFRNLHLHLGEAMFTGMPVTSLEEYLAETERFQASIPMEEREQLWQDSAELTSWQAVSGGTCAIVSPRSCAVARQWGLRALSLFPVMNSNKLRSFFETDEAGVSGWLKATEEQGCETGLFLHSAEWVDQRWLERAAALRHKKPGLWISAHIAETAASVAACHERWGEGAVTLLARSGLLGPYTLLVHGCHLSPDELALLAESGTGLVLCPVSNWRLGTLLPPLSELLKMGVRVCIGTDGPGTAGNVLPLEHARLAGALLRVQDPHLLLSLITSAPARMLHERAPAGRIAPGGRADLFFISSGGAFNSTCSDPAETLVWGGTLEPLGLMVAGNMLWSRPPLGGPALTDPRKALGHLKRLRLQRTEIQ